MSIQIIDNKKHIDGDYSGKIKTAPKDKVLRVSEMFSNTIQGEGVYSGHPATFLRLQGCTLNCIWCDTAEVWRRGSPYHINELSRIIPSEVVYRLRKGEHLVITGGSPLKQQKAVVNFIERFILDYGFKPFIEIENECVLIPDLKLIELVDCWNNSPKLENSGMRSQLRLKSDVLNFMNRIKAENWFKFVISGYSDWDEIAETYLPYIDKKKIILMPEADSIERLNHIRPTIAEIAIKNGVRFSDRLHVTLWDKLTGV